MKVLFVDIDGVVNNVNTFKKYPEALFPIDPYMAFLVGKILLDTGAVAVLSSAWRYDEGSKEVVRKRVCDFVDITPMNKGMSSRGTEIKEWLDAHHEVTKYAILDDNSDMLQEQLPNFFKCPWDTGLTDEIAAQVIKHLS